MATSLRRVANHSSNAHRFVFPQLVNRFSTDALSVEYKRGEIGTVSGIPDEHLQRRVLIYSPARTASQQGAGKVGKWKINFLSTQSMPLSLLLWENPLMGWTSTGDPYANVGDSALSFDSEADARGFAERHGWDYTIQTVITDAYFNHYVLYLKVRHCYVSEHRILYCVIWHTYFFGLELIYVVAVLFFNLVKKHQTPLYKFSCGLASISPILLNLIEGSLENYKYFENLNPLQQLPPPCEEDEEGEALGEGMKDKVGGLADDGVFTNDEGLVGDNGRMGRVTK
ncbi:hypothetical protein OSB04_007462 [Centaurea solstitialis]|uniref:NADH dehydrogenase [ubiquinone] iron-sulfur protein 4, mitochondrial n=1 Tax=Centaurea solstitialis TaxID=347529 RepID=A0AA38U355_9ASTR|nr:hypothetical protein OSB04_007462 [Centaurea solstitialis]